MKKQEFIFQLPYLSCQAHVVWNTCYSGMFFKEQLSLLKNSIRILVQSLLGV